MKYIKLNNEFVRTSNEDVVIHKLKHPNSLIYTEAQKKALMSFNAIPKADVICRYELYVGSTYIGVWRDDCMPFARPPSDKPLMSVSYGRIILREYLLGY